MREGEQIFGGCGGVPGFQPISIVVVGMVGSGFLDGGEEEKSGDVGAYTTLHSGGLMSPNGGVVGA